MQMKKNTKHTRDKLKWIYAQWTRPNRTKPNPEYCKNCSPKCAYNCAQIEYTIHSQYRI